MRIRQIFGKRLWVGLLSIALLVGMLPTAGVAYAEEPEDNILFADDFSDADATASWWDAISGNWQVANGVYSPQDTNAGAIAYSRSGVDWTDYELEVTATRRNGNSLMLYGRVQENRDRYIFTFTGTDLEFTRRIDATRESLDKVTVSCPMEANQSYHINIRFVGSHMAVYVEERLVLEVDNAAYPSGGIGLACYKAWNDFDKVMVREIVGDNTLTVTGVPNPYQVIQRNAATQNASVSLQGRASGENVSRVQAAVVPYAGGTPVVDWTDMVLTDHSYAGTLTVPQGGWYRLQVQTLDADDAVLETLTDDRQWGVGINILCIGQSNMVGQDKGSAYTPADERAANFRNGAWSHLADPYDGVGASLVPAMVNALIQELDIPVGVIPAADSGSGLAGLNPAMSQPANWYWMYYNEENPADTGTLYGRALSRARAAGGVELAVWNQGETDGYIGTPQETYVADMRELLARFRHDLKNEALPLFLCQIGPHVKKAGFTDEQYTAIRNAQNELDDGQNFFMAATEHDIPQISDGVHYSKAGLDIVGERVANSILVYYGESGYYRGPFITSASFTDTDHTAIDVQIQHRGGRDITPASGITGFTVLGTDGSDIAVTSAERLAAAAVRLTLSRAAADGAYVRYLYGVKPDGQNVVKDDTALALPLEATTTDIPVADENIDDIADAFSFTTDEGTMVYPVSRLVEAERYTTSSEAVTLASNKTNYALIPPGETSCTYQAFTNTQVDDWVAFRLPVKAGAYKLGAQTYTHTGRGQYRLYLADGTPLGGTFQQQGGVDNADTADRVPTDEYGTLMIPQSGDLVLRFRVTGAGPKGGYTMAFCNILLTPLVFEPDDDGVITYPVTQLPTTTHSETGSDPTYTYNDAQLDGPQYSVIRTQQVGDWVEYTLPQVQPGIYTLSAQTYTHPNLRGKCRLYLPDKDEYLGGEVNQTGGNNDTSPAERARVDRLGEIVVTEAGDLRLRFVVTGLNGNNAGLAFLNILLKQEPVNVIFFGKFNETVAVKQAASIEALQKLLTDTKAPALGGYQFVGWDEPADNAASLFDAALRQEAGERSVKLSARYDIASDEAYTLTLGAAMTARDGQGANVTADTPLTFDQRITVTVADEYKDKVVYWKLDGAAVGFGQNAYTFYISGSNKIEVVLNGTAPTEPAVVLQQAMASGAEGSYTLTAIAQTSFSAGYTLVECGVYYTGSVATLTALAAGDTDVDKTAYVQVPSKQSTAGRQYMTHLLNVQPERTRYARAYAVMQDSQGEKKTVWSTRVYKFVTPGADNLAVTITKGEIHS